MSDARQKANRRYSQRSVLKAAASLNGDTWLDVLGATLSADGHTLVVMTTDGARLAGTITGDEPQPVTITPAKAKKVYAPKSWDAAQWNRNVEIIRQSAMTKESVKTNLAEMSDKDGSEESKKRLRHAVAVIDAVPDAPDWYDYLPLA